MNRSVLLSIVVLLGCGCHHFVRRSDLPEKPKDADVRKMTQEWAAENLEVPEGAKFRDFSEPKPGYRRTRFMAVELPGWVWSVSINDRNRFGAYSGYKNHWFLYGKDGEVYGARGRWDMEPWSFFSNVGPFVIAKGVEDD